MKKAIIILGLIGLPLIYALSKTSPEESALISIPPTPQRSGYPAKGYIYLITGDFIKSGIPYPLFKLVNGSNTRNYLNREGKNATVGHQFNVVRNNGSDVVVPTCLQCHSQVFNGKLIVGLGNTFLDFSKTRRVNLKLVDRSVRLMYPGYYTASKDFLKAFAATFPEMQTATRGVNVADKLAIILAAHRDPQTLKWSDSALLPIPNEVYPVDVPPWWWMKKKHAMFYSGFARGDQATFMMLANMLTVKDSAEAREVSNHFSDVLAYIRTIEPPTYPFAIDSLLANKGKSVFNNNCSRCHGIYGSGGYYPNLLVPITIVQTDSTLCQGVEKNYPFIKWFERSWFVQGAHSAGIVPFNGYIAPPLDGIWVTAPYLHNGSVPTLEALLNSKLRPTYWSRDFKHAEYDYQAVGWKYNIHHKPKRRKIYNTMRAGYSNSGHYFGDELNQDERMAVIEYLKTL